MGDTLASFALSTAPPEEDILEGEPMKKEDQCITDNMWRNIIGQSVY